MAGKLISDLNSGTLSIDDVMEIDKDVSGTRTSYKTTVKDIVDFANHNVAEEYDSTSTYAVDDYCIYESVLYKCIGTTTGTFDSTKWTAVVVTNEMGSGGGGSWTDVTGTLTAGSTSITLSNQAITTSSTLDYYTSIFGVNPLSVSVSTGSVTLTFEAQSTNVDVKVRIS